MKEKIYTLAGVKLNLTQVSVLLTGELGYTVIGKLQTRTALRARGLMDGYSRLTPLGKQAVAEWRAR